MTGKNCFDFSVSLQLESRFWLRRARKPDH